MTRIHRALLSYCDDRDPRIYTNSNALLNLISNFKLVWFSIDEICSVQYGSLSKYLQGKDVDVITA